MLGRMFTKISQRCVPMENSAHQPANETQSLSHRRLLKSFFQMRAHLWTASNPSSRSPGMFQALKRITWCVIASQPFLKPRCNVEVFGSRSSPGASALFFSKSYYWQIRYWTYVRALLTLCEEYVAHYLRE